jgi:hypothetical protein
MWAKKSKLMNLSVKVKDDVKATDKMHTYKRWFNGMKHFFTVKTLPPRK